MRHLPTRRRSGCSVSPSTAGRFRQTSTCCSRVARPCARHWRRPAAAAPCAVRSRTRMPEKSAPSTLPSPRSRDRKNAVDGRVRRRRDPRPAPIGVDALGAVEIAPHPFVLVQHLLKRRTVAARRPARGQAPPRCVSTGQRSRSGDRAVSHRRTGPRRTRASAATRATPTSPRPTCVIENKVTVTGQQLYARGE